MPARIQSTILPRKSPGLPLFFGLFFAVLFIWAANARAQTAAHSPGWVVLPVEEYRTLHARAYPTEREPEPPPVEATLTRVDYDLRINGDLASGRASLTVDVLKDGWVRVPIPAGLLVRGPGWTASSSLSYLAWRQAGGQLSALLLIPVALFRLRDCSPVATSAGEESISLPSPRQASPSVRFRARAWTSALLAVFFPRNLKPPPKAMDRVRLRK